MLVDVSHRACHLIAGAQHLAGMIVDVAHKRLELRQHRVEALCDGSDLVSATGIGAQAQVPVGRDALHRLREGRQRVVDAADDEPRERRHE